MAPSFVNKDYVTAGSLIALHMHIMRYLLGHKLLCALGIYELHIKSSSIHCCIVAVSFGSATGGENIAYLLLWLPRQPQERGRVVLGDALATHAAASARRETVSRLPCQPGENKCVCSL